MAARSILLLSLMVPATLAQGQRITGSAFATRSEVIARHGMAATAHPLATQAALDILRQGGSAVDAAIAANACLAFLEPTACGVGGDLMALLWNPAERRVEGLNASGRAPATISIEAVRALGHTTIPPRGALPVSVPGCVDGWIALHQRHGRLPLAQVLQPAIALAREGAPVPEVIAAYWQFAFPRLESFPNFTETFGIDGRAPTKGDIFRNPGLANTLESIAREGRDGFYRGPVAAAIAAEVRAQGGFLSEDDLARNEPTWVEPVSVRYRGHDVWALPPPTQGIATLQILRLLERHDVASLGWGSPAHLHLFIEAKKLAFEDRGRFYADPAFTDIPWQRLLDDDAITRRAARINPARAARGFPADDPRAGAGDTTYLCTADSSGMMVSLIQSNYRGFGSGVVPAGTGFMLQNRGEQFSLDPAHPNALAPGKRPFHTIIPGFVTKDGHPFLAFGVMGGSYQPQGQAWVLSNLLDFGMNLQEAGDAPRVEHEGSTEPVGTELTVMADGGRVMLEHGFPENTVRDLYLQLGHDVSDGRPNFGGFQGILFDAARGVYLGASESRKDGQAAGY
jgi:gamma-glutamyltranspeptidase/glutathione hydrolase